MIFKTAKKAFQIRTVKDIIDEEKHKSILHQENVVKSSILDQDLF